MPTFFLVLSEDPQSWAKYTPEQMQEVLGKYMAWGMKMREQGRIVGGSKLKDEGGKIVRKAEKRLKVVDGPYAETKDVIGGFYLLKAESYDHCIQLIQDHPHLEYGQTIAVREIDPIGEE